MRILCLDLSTHTGYAIFDGEMGSKPKLLRSGTIDLGKPVHAFGPYPHSYRIAAWTMVQKIWSVVGDDFVDAMTNVVVIEEINSGRDRYVQKLLENIHTATLQHTILGEKSVYLNSDGADGWRTNLGLVMTKEQKKLNAKLSKAKRTAEAAGAKLDKKALGIKGKTTKKHLAVARANAEYDLKLKQKDNNEADAICLGLAYCNNATPCDGVR